jgi:probable phosphoglycerate mutase
VLLRHGRTAWNEAGRAQGHADVPLDATGRGQAAAAAPYLASLRPAVLWSSDLARARETCEHVERATGLSAKYDERLRELDVGERQGLTAEQFAERFPDEHAAWADGEFAVRLPGAEVTSDVAARMLPALRECLGSLGAGETGVVVTHGAALRVGIAGLLGWSAGLAADLQGVHNCSWATLRETGHGGRLRLVGYNESVRPGHEMPEPPRLPAPTSADFASGSPVG